MKYLLLFSGDQQDQVQSSSSYLPCVAFGSNISSASKLLRHCSAVLHLWHSLFLLTWSRLCILFLSAAVCYLGLAKYTQLEKKRTVNDNVIEPLLAQCYNFSCYNFLKAFCQLLKS